MSTFSSIAFLLEKLRLEINGTKIKHGGEKDDYQQLNKVEEEWKHGRSHKNSPNIHLISSLMDKAGGPTSLTETVRIFILSTRICFRYCYCYNYLSVHVGTIFSAMQRGPSSAVAVCFMDTSQSP